MMRKSGILLSCLLVLGAAMTVAAQDRLSSPPALGGEIQLVPKIYRDWKIRLPAETAAEVGTALRFKETLGADFAAGLDGLTLLVDADGDGELETKVKGEAGFVVLTKGDKRYGIRLKAAPNWVFAPGSTMAGEIEGVRVQIIDQNLNGRFDDFGEDAMVVGRGKTAAFLSKVIDLGDGRLVSIEVAADGSKLGYQAYTGATGRLDLGIVTSGKVLAAVLQSRDGAYSVACSGAEKELLLPAGDYRFHSGLISLGGNRVNVQTGRSKTVTVPANGEAALELGGPITAAFNYARSGNEFQFDPNAIWFHGKAGEEYVGWEPLGKSPKISILAGKSGREIAQAYFPGSC